MIINIEVVFSAFIWNNSILKFMMLQMNASVPTTIQEYPGCSHNFLVSLTGQQISQKQRKVLKLIHLWGKFRSKSYGYWRHFFSWMGSLTSYILGLRRQNIDVLQALGEFLRYWIKPAILKKLTKFIKFVVCNLLKSFLVLSILIYFTRVLVNPVCTSTPKNLFSYKRFTQLSNTCTLGFLMTIFVKCSQNQTWFQMNLI